MFTLRPRRVDFKVATTCRVVSQCEISDQSPVSMFRKKIRRPALTRASPQPPQLHGRLVFHVGLSVKILLAIMGDRAHRMNGESQVRSQN
jgi:hypothetical protein